MRKIIKLEKRIQLLEAQNKALCDDFIRYINKNQRQIALLAGQNPELEKHLNNIWQDDEKNS